MLRNLIILRFAANDSVFTGVFTCQRVACEDAGRAAYSQLHWHVTGEDNRHQAAISSQITELHAIQFTHSKFTRTRTRKS